MAKNNWLFKWPALRQLASSDTAGLGEAAMTERTRTLKPRIADADKVVGSICPEPSPPSAPSACASRCWSRERRRHGSRKRPSMCSAAG
ncbi:hypothetical protein [Geomonas azotofigens]|uniref:hypothetical protein n=1 Tax=Geomonas azotofigens TaxID=2843196 RepID=UPI001C11280B|nr:hypothetical protein [Geomonas azotofigens]MBU5613946.1 hypothetical protein [Geomonas azotofigens]